MTGLTPNPRLGRLAAALNGVRSSWPTPEEFEATKDYRPTERHQ